MSGFIRKAVGIQDLLPCKMFVPHTYHSIPVHSAAELHIRFLDDHAHIMTMKTAIMAIQSNDLTQIHHLAAVYICFLLITKQEQALKIIMVKFDLPLQFMDRV